MIRNLKKQGDEEKQLMLLKEQLRLAIKNDEAISASRRDSQQNIPIELSREDSRTLAEQLADDVTQRENAQKFLSEFFRGAEVQTILGLTSKDQIIAINTLWSGIKEELKRVNTKAMTPRDFITFLNKYTDTAVSLQGALTVGINSTEELKELIPDQENLEKVFDFIRDRSSNPRIPILILSELGNYIPSESNYNSIDTLDAMLKKQTIDTILGANFPNKNALERAVEEGSVSKIEKLLQSFTPDKLAMLKKLKATLDGIPLPPSPVRKPPPSRPLPSKKATDVTAIKAMETFMTKVNADYLNNIPPPIKNAINNFRSGLPLDPRFEADYAEYVLNNAKGVSSYINSRPTVEKPFLLGRVNRNNPSQPDKYEIIGSGIKRGRGRPPLNNPKKIYKLKIGEGIKFKREPVNVEFGRYALNTNQLKKQILHIKNRQGGALSWFSPVPISDNFTELIEDLIKTNAVNKHLLKILDKDEQNMFYEVVDRSGLIDGLGLKKPEDTTEKDLMEKFQILLGEYKAGNNSSILTKQLRKHIIYFTNKGKIPKQKSLSMLMELSD